MRSTALLISLETKLLESIWQKLAEESIQINSTLSFIGNSTFGNNSAIMGGAGVNTLSSTLNINGNTSFINNSAVFGGGIGVHDS